MSTHAWQSSAFELPRPRRSLSFLAGLGLAVALLALIAVSATRPAPVPAPEGALSFVENAGQEDAAVRYAAHASGASFFFTQKEAVLAFERGDEGLALRLGFVAANPAAEIEAQSLRAGTVNYLVGDASEWRSGIPTYGEVVYRDLWPGIDMHFRGANGTLKYEFVVAPGADPSRIGLAYRGADGLALGAGGQLLIQTPLGTLRDEKPRSFQVVDGRRLPVDSRFALGQKGAYGFALGAYDARRELVIDPGLVYLTYLGGTGRDETVNVALGEDGDAYVTGYTESPDFPASAGAFDASRDGVSDGFVTRFDATGELVYSTFIGGSDYDAATTVAVDALGRAYVGGATHSSDFPTSPGALRTTKGPSSDAFVTRLSADGASLSYSTYLGGSGASVEDLALDSSGAVVLAGATLQPGIPTTPGAFDVELNGDDDGFVAKLSADGSELVYATYLGGTECDLERPTAVAVDSDGNAYVTGYASSPDFPTTPGAFDTTGEGCSSDLPLDAYVSKLDPTGSTLVYSTFLQGDNIDSGFGIAVDQEGSAYAVGATQSPEFPTTAGAFDGSPGGLTDGYVAKLDPAGSELEFSTFLGGAGSDNAVAVALREDGRIYVGGGTGGDFPTTPGAYDESANGSDDAFVASLDPAGSDVLYGTYIGGSGNDYGLWGLGVDDDGVAVYAGYTESSDLPTSEGAFDSTFGGGFLDGWVAKIATEDAAPTATERIEEAISRLEGLTTPQNADKVEDVVEKLEKALAKLAQSPPDRQGAAGELEGAVGDIDSAVRSRLLPSADGAAVMTEIAQAARSLAEDAIADAQGGNAAKIDEAEAALEAGDARLAAGRFKAAIALYKDAISKAEGA